MKTVKIVFIGSVFLMLCACVSSPYVSKYDKGNFNEVKAGKTYQFFHDDDLMAKMNVTSIEKDSIIGIEKDQRRALAKNKISRIQKNNTAGTVILVSTLTASAVLVGVFFKAVLDIGKGLGGGGN